MSSYLTQTNIKMENITEYYTPEKKELCIGMEYQFNDFGTDGELLSDWRDAIIKNGTQIDDITRLENGKEVYALRVKKLLRECIESLGWEFVNSAFGDYCLNNKYFLTYRNESIKIGYDEGFQVWKNVCCGVPCKNKSELSKLMTMLNIKI